MELLLNHGFLAAGEKGEQEWREKELAKIREARFQRLETGQAEGETGDVSAKYPRCLYNPYTATWGTLIE